MVKGDSSKQIHERKRSLASRLRTNSADEESILETLVEKATDAERTEGNKQSFHENDHSSSEKLSKMAVLNN